MKEYGRENFADDLMHSHLHDTILKLLVAEQLIETEHDDEAYEEERAIKLRPY
jgi:hypothetical protein